MINSMVVVPQHARILAIGVEVVLELTGVSDILSPAIPRRTLIIIICEFCIMSRTREAHRI